MVRKRVMMTAAAGVALANTAAVSNAADHVRGIVFTNAHIPIG